MILSLAVAHLLCLWFVLFPSASSAPAPLSESQFDKKALFGPEIDLPYATVIGSSAFGVDSFKGIPYAIPPIGQLRLKHPRPIVAHLGTINLPDSPRACPQQGAKTFTGNEPADALAILKNNPLFQAISNAGEDCLTLSVQKPSTALAGDKLPVLFWIYGGSYTFGSTQSYDGANIVRTSISNGKPIIFVAVNYRVGGFGFLAGAQVKADGSSNIGLMDQRAGMKWVADNIESFGGDPAKVTIWGESAGAASVFYHLFFNDGNNKYKGTPLFRAAIMNSGSLVPSDPVTSNKSELVYGTVVKNAGCSGSADTLACLRSVDYATFYNAAQSVPDLSLSPNFALPYVPRPDGKQITASPEDLIQVGKYAKVPFIVGDQEDEGTLFGLLALGTDASNTTGIAQYLADQYFSRATMAQIESIVETYSTDLADGSPFRTGIFNELYPGFKRLSAVLGDLAFTLTRRYFLELATAAQPNVPSWSYLATYSYGVPFLGTFHASDIGPSFGYTFGSPSISIQSYYLSFVTDLDPNARKLSSLPTWPQWKESKSMLSFDMFSNSIIKDTFRSLQYESIKTLVGLPGGILRI